MQASQIRVKSEGKAFIIDCSPTPTIIKNHGTNLRLQINQDINQEQRLEDVSKQLKNLILLATKE